MKYFTGLVLSFLLAFNLSIAQDFALERLEDSPRHHEWVEVQYDGRTVHSFVVYPEVSDKATAVIVIHENRGLTDWVRSLADQMAEAGFIAIAPDLLSGSGPDSGKTSDFATSDDARSAIYELDQDQVSADLQAVQDYVADLPACNGKTTVAGFCWGGSQTFRFATNDDEIEAAFVFYGTGPKEAEAYESIEAPVYGFYGGDDARVNSTIPDSEKFMETAGKTYEPVIYEGAGHAFMRRGDDPATESDDPNKIARDQAFERLVGLLEKI